MLVNPSLLIRKAFIIFLELGFLVYKLNGNCRMVSKNENLFKPPLVRIFYGSKEESHQEEDRKEKDNQEESQLLLLLLLTLWRLKQNYYFRCFYGPAGKFERRLGYIESSRQTLFRTRGLHQSGPAGNDGTRSRYPHRHAKVAIYH